MNKSYRILFNYNFNECLDEYKNIEFKIDRRRIINKKEFSKIKEKEFIKAFNYI